MVGVDRRSKPATFRRYLTDRSIQQFGRHFRLLLGHSSWIWCKGRILSEICAGLMSGLAYLNEGNPSQVKGTIPLTHIAGAARLPGHALSVLLTVHHQTALTKKDCITLPKAAHV